MNKSMFGVKISRIKLFVHILLSEVIHFFSLLLLYLVGENSLIFKNIIEIFDYFRLNEHINRMLTVYGAKLYYPITLIYILVG